MSKAYPVLVIIHLLSLTSFTLPTPGLASVDRSPTCPVVGRVLSPEETRLPVNQ